MAASNKRITRITRLCPGHGHGHGHGHGYGDRTVSYKYTFHLSSSLL